MIYCAGLRNKNSELSHPSCPTITVPQTVLICQYFFTDFLLKDFKIECFGCNDCMGKITFPTEFAPKGTLRCAGWRHCNHQPVDGYDLLFDRVDPSAQTEEGKLLACEA